MKYQVLAQKYRPQDFDDVIGQEVVARTLRNSVISGRVANAYIFCGSRGVGKTSVARLLSKMLNCEKAPEKRPCNECPSCLGITGGNDIDVLEIDGASNNGVDEIRTLRENVKFSPSKSRYKIYIIDEVHMLSQGAFNALLKTLEEPPAHVKFIFATTESHKVLPTIMSRCQRFDFKRISPVMITERLTDIAKKEGINIEEKALVLIARSSDGSLRDALVMLDQMLSFSGKKITAADVTELLGMVQTDSMFGLSNAIIDCDIAQVALTIDEMINSGKDPVAVTNSLISHYRDVMIIKAAGKPTSDMALAADELENIKSEAERLSLDEILYFLQALSHTLTLMKGVILTRAPLEITLMRLTRRGTVLSLPAILEKLEKMEEGIGGGAAGFLPEEEDNEAAAVDNSYRQPARSTSPAPASASSDDNGDEAAGADMQYLDASSPSWKAVLNYIKSKKMLVHTMLSDAKPLEQSEKKVVIGFGKDKTFNKDSLETSSNKSLIEEALSIVLGRPVNVEFTMMEFLGETSGVIPKAPSAKTQVIKEQMKPIIEQAMDVFGGHIVRDITGGGE